jgi:hypothetical protein
MFATRIISIALSLTGDGKIENLFYSVTCIKKSSFVQLSAEQKGDPVSDNVLSLLEHIDDDAINYEHPIKLVRIDDDEEAKEQGFLK